MNPHFLQQQVPQPQQQGQPGHMSLLQNGQGPNPAVGLMQGQPGSSNPSYPLNMQTANNHQRQVFSSMGHPQHTQINPSGGAGPSHMSGLGPSQLQNMAGYGPNGMPLLNRVPSQTTMNQGSGHMGGMTPGMMNGMAMSSHPGIPRVRPGMPAMTPQQLQQPHNVRLMQAHQQPVHQGQIAGDIGLLARHSHLTSANGISPHTRTASAQAQLANHPQSQSHPGAIPHAMQQNGFGGQMSLGHPMQQSPLGSQHAGPSQPHPSMTSGNMPGGMSISPQVTGNRQRITPDQFGGPMIMHFGNGNGLSHRLGTNAQFLGHPPSPSNTTADMGQVVANNQMNIANQRNFMNTPAQVLALATGGDNFSADFPMSQSNTIIAPARPPSHNATHGTYQMSGSPPTLQSQSSPHQPQMNIQNMHPVQRPQSQPQASHRQSPLPPGARTPRVSNPPLPLNSNMMPPRLPSAHGHHSPQGPPHTSIPTTAPPGSGSSSVPITQQRPPGAPPVGSATFASASASSASASTAVGAPAPAVDAPAPQPSPEPRSDASGPRKP